MKEFNIPKITPGEYIFEVADEMEIDYLIWFYAPFTGCSKRSFPAGFQFTLSQYMRDDAFYILPIDIDKDEEDRLCAPMREEAKALYPELANRIQGFSFFVTEEDLKSSHLRFIKGELGSILDIIAKQKEKTEYLIKYESFDNPEWVEENFGSTYKKMEEQLHPKVLKEEIKKCPSCGYDLRPVFWGEVTPEILQKKQKGEIFIGEVLYGKLDKDQPEYACGNCGASFVLDK